MFCSNDPQRALVNGFHIHMDTQPDETQKAQKVYQDFLKYLNEQNITPTGHTTYEPNSGPHVLRGWVVKFEIPDAENAMRIIGVSISWLMLNRSNLPILIHPNTARERDSEARIRDHGEYAITMGKPTPINLSYFDCN